MSTKVWLKIGVSGLEEIENCICIDLVATIELDYSNDFDCGHVESRIFVKERKTSFLKTSCCYLSILVFNQ